MHIIEEKQLESHKFVFKALLKATQWKISVKCVCVITVVIEVRTCISVFRASFITG